MKIKLKKKSVDVEAQKAQAFGNEKLAAAVVSFNSAIDQLDDVLVERSNEITAIKLCLLAREHIILEGSPGVAKSRIAHELFRRIKGASTFQKQLTSTTQPDEVFGCMNSKKYREQAIWEYNTKDMLPECHIGFLDEVYRVAKSFLSNLFSVMNEREFYNGGIVMKCPLMTIIGTTNFTTIDDELNAFHDRWLVKAQVSALTGAQARLQMLEKVLRPKQSELLTVSLNELELMQKAVRQVDIPSSILELYEELVTTTCKAAKLTVTDRRLVQTLKLVQASYVMDDNRPDEFSEAYLSAAQYGFITVNGEATAEFSSVFERLVGSRLQAIGAEKKLLKIEQSITELEADYDPKMSRSALEETFQTTFRYISALSNVDRSDLGNSRSNDQMVEKLLAKAHALNNSSRAQLSEVIVKELKAEDEE